jgi:hypothetical protein
MRTFWQAAVAALAILAAPALAQAAPDGPKPLFTANDVIHIVIKAPITTIVSARLKSQEPVDGSLTVQGGESLPIKLAVRGLTRRTTDACAFPPLRVDFDGKPPAAPVFAGQKRLKLVTYCRLAPAYQQNLLLEYSAYKLYNLITPISFNVRLVMVDYVDADGKALASRLGYFIEDAKDVAHRNGLSEAEVGDKAAISQLSSPAAARAAVFEYMIGNLDWSMTIGPKGDGCCHNFKLLAAKGATGDFIPLPYDYDFSGLVDAPYAVPPDSVHVASVRVRRYRGYCAYNAAAPAAAAAFRARRAEMLAVYDTIPQMEEATRHKARDYLAGFFDQIGSDQDVTDHLLKACLG